MILCNEIINAADSVATNVMSTVSTIVTSTASIKFHDKKVRYKMYCYTILLVNILVFITTSNCYHYTKHRLKQKTVGHLTIENEE